MPAFIFHFSSDLLGLCVVEVVAHEEHDVPLVLVHPHLGLGHLQELVGLRMWEIAVLLIFF